MAHIRSIIKKESLHTNIKSKSLQKKVLKDNQKAIEWKFKKRAEAKQLPRNKWIQLLSFRSKSILIASMNLFVH